MICCDVVPGSEVVRFTVALSLFNMISASASASCCVLGVRGTVKVSASECRLAFSATFGGAGTTNEVILVSKSVELVVEWTVRGNNGGAVVNGDSSVVDVCEFVIRFWLIFSSIRALTLTLAVWRGGPFASFLSHFLFSASCRREIID